MRRRTLAALLLLAGPAAAQDSVTVVAGPAFARGGLHRFLLGDNYRSLWTTPIRVPVLDLEAEAGGLTPLQRGGGLQTRSLRLRGGDGAQYVFRVLEKDPSRVLPAELRGTFVDDLLRDQMSAMHPGGALVVPPILEAAGVLHVVPRLMVMPDDPRLGEFRAEFGGHLGTLELRPTEGDDESEAFAAASGIVSTADLIEAQWRRPWIRVDSRAFLTARLLDLFLGDWDRHEGQWRWALVSDAQGERYLPIPRDRDQVFARYGGLLLDFGREVAPQLLKFSDRYGPPEATTWNGRNLDRRLLVDLERPVWDSVARAIRAAVTDEVLDSAISRLPVEYQARDGASLRETLRRRRDRLPEAADRLYRFLARQVRIQGGERDDVVTVNRLDAGRTEVQIARREGTVWFHRVFDPSETREIQLDLRGGDDVVVIRGGRGGPLIRAIGGSGADTLADSSAGRRSRFYDIGDRTVVVGGRLDRRRYIQPADTSAAALPERDWGARTMSFPRVTGSSDLGLTFGFTQRRLGYGFRRQPYATSLALGLDYSLGRASARTTLDARWRHTGRDMYTTLDLLASGIETLQFHGFGNGTVRTDVDTDFYRVWEEVFEVSPGVGFGLEGRKWLRLRLRARHTVTDPDEPVNRDGLIGQVRPLGLGDFGQLGLSGEAQWDSRDYPLLPTRGVRLWVETNWYPVTWSRADGAFGSVEALAAAFVSPGAQDWLTFAFRVGGRQVWGDYPYHEAAFLGGNRTLRGYHQNRFAGDASLHGTTEIRLRLARPVVLVPGEFGVFGLADAGRVYSDFDTSDRWHTDAGGGVWYGVLNRAGVLALGAAKGREATRLYVGLGLGF